MALALTQPDGSTFRLFYSGPIGVNGVGVTQSWDLSLMPKAVREDPTFQDNWRVFARQVDPGITNVDPDVAFNLGADGIPDEVVLTLDASADADEISIEFWYLHSVVR